MTADAHTAPDNDPFTRETLAFRTARIARLTSDEGWLAQVGRYPLELGENHLPIGTITLDDRGVATLSVPDDGRVVTLAADGQRVRARVLRDDSAGPADRLIHQELN